MPTLVNLTGIKIDHITVIKQSKSKNKHVYWECICDCGNKCEFSGETLRRKRSIPLHCGCQNKKNQLKKYDLTGQRFGKLTVLEKTEERKNRSVVWKCQCDCGNIKNIPTHLLTSGHTKSCGCLSLETHLIDISQQKFGKLTALEYIGDKKWLCKCDCGNFYEVDSYLLRNKVVTSCGCINYSIGEKNIKEILDNNNFIYIKEYTCSELNKKRFDFAIIKNNQIIRFIEFDGEQHYTERKGSWGRENSLESIQKSDIEKNIYALSHGIPLVRIPYWERDSITLEMLMGDKYLIK